MNSEPQHRQARDLVQIHADLRALYAEEYPTGAPHLYERLVRRLPSYIAALVRRKLDLLVQYETDDTVQSSEDLMPADSDTLSIFLNPQVLRAHLDVGRDSTLSSDGHSIAHFDTQPPIVAHQLINVASGDHPETLERRGCVFLDVDGTKTIVDSTSHAHAGRYLEALAEFLSRPPESLRSWLKDRKLEAEAYTVAGDEFIVMLCSEASPLDKATLDDFSREVQKTIAADAHLTSFISFDDPEFVMEYDDWSDEDRAAYEADADAMSERLKLSRGKLPDRFTPSVSCGSATLLEALHEALSPDTEVATTLEALGVNAVGLMKDKADARMKEDKRIFRENLTDPKLRAFLQRNNENRLLHKKLTDAELKNIQLEARVAELELENRNHLKKILDQDATIFRLTEDNARIERLMREMAPEPGAA